MARSPLTLAASVTSALPGAVVVGVAALSEGAGGRYDAAVATLHDGAKVVIRVPVDAAAENDLRSDARALSALTQGVRSVLPFHAPFVVGETSVDGRNAVVQTWSPGYRVDAAHVPSGPGIASALGTAIAAVHALPASIVRDAGLPLLTAAQVRDEAERLLDRCEATGLLPFGLLRRWSTALGSDALWRFESTVTAGGVDPASFLFEDDAEGVPRVTGLLHWGGLSVGDPAKDLRWLASAPDARTAVLDAYTDAASHAPDAALWERARLHAELEFAAWLVQGHETGAESVVADAVGLLEALDESVRDAPPLAQDSITVDDAIAALGRVASDTATVDTSMQTDTYDAEALGEYAADDAEPPARTSADEETAPLEWEGWADAGTTSAGATTGDDTQRSEHDAEPRDEDIDEAARNALRRWTESA